MTVSTMTVAELQTAVEPGALVEFKHRRPGQRGRAAKAFGTFKKFNQNGTVRVQTAWGVKTLDVTEVSFIIA